MSLLVQIQQKPERLSHAEEALADYIKRIRDQAEKRNAGGQVDLLAELKKQREKMGIKE